MTEVPVPDTRTRCAVPGTRTYCSVYRRMLYPYPHPGIFFNGIPVPRVLCHGHAELTESAGYGYECRSAYKTARKSDTGSTRETKYPGCVFTQQYRTKTLQLTEVSGTGMAVLQNSQKLRLGKYYVYECCTSRTRTRTRARTRTGVFFSPKDIPLPWVLCHVRTAVHNLKKFRVQV